MFAVATWWIIKCTCETMPVDQFIFEWHRPYWCFFVAAFLGNEIEKRERALERQIDMRDARVVSNQRKRNKCHLVEFVSASRRIDSIGTSNCLGVESKDWWSSFFAAVFRFLCHWFGKKWFIKMPFAWDVHYSCRTQAHSFYAFRSTCASDIYVRRTYVVHFVLQHLREA